MYKLIKLSTGNEAAEQATAWAPGKNPASTVTSLSKPLRPLTRKQQAFIHQLVDNPRMSATQAVKHVYGKPDKPVTDGTARMMASENLAKPSIMTELSKYSNTAENTLIEVMTRSKDKMMSEQGRAVDWANTARQTADSILDRLHGKATTKIEQTTTAVTLNIDLSGITDTENNK